MDSMALRLEPVQALLDPSEEAVPADSGFAGAAMLGGAAAVGSVENRTSARVAGLERALCCRGSAEAVRILSVDLFPRFPLVPCGLHGVVESRSASEYARPSLEKNELR
jgi:hypothetical protein